MTEHRFDAGPFEGTSPITWNLDHAASGDRLRAWLEHAEVLVYWGSGEWEIRPYGGSGKTMCEGEEETAELARQRVLKVYAALFDCEAKDRKKLDP